MTTAQFRAQAGKPQMTQGIFHITVATLIGTMAVFGVAIATATAPSRGGETAKVAPVAAPVAAAIPAAPIASPQPAPATSSNPLLDGCVISAIGRLPKADGLKVTKSSYEFRNSVPLQGRPLNFWTVSVSVDLHGRQANYVWLCEVYGNEARLKH